MNAKRYTFARALGSDILVNGLRLFWVTLVIWGEFGVFFYSLSSCRWPDKLFHRPKSSPRASHILLVADPHVLPDTQSRAHTLVQRLRDIHLRKSWTAVRRLRPHTILFLGDMLASGGAIKDDDEYETYVHKFKNTFPVDPDVEVRYLPGNSDVGLGEINSFTKHVQERYTDHFGALNQRISIANCTLVLLDAPGLVNEDYLRAGSGVSFDHWTPLKDGPIEFVTAVATDHEQGPIILFSHIPLHRAESRACGPLRERGTIRRGVGHGWQSSLGKQTSTFLLQSLKPVVVFSADDRDYCDITHIIASNVSSASSSTQRAEIHEITVKSISLAPQITRPGFQLLSLLPTDPDTSTDAPTFAHTPCFLPSAHHTYTGLYIPFFLLTSIALLVYHIRKSRRRLFSPSSSSSRLNPSHITPIPSPYSSSNYPTYTNMSTTQPGLASSPYSEPLAHLSPNAAFGRDTIGSGLRTPRTPKTPWTPWSPVTASTTPNLDSQVEEVTDDVEKTPRTPMSKATSGSSASGTLVSSGFERTKAVPEEPDDEEEDDEAQYVYVTPRGQEKGLGLGPIGIESARVEKGEDKSRRCGWAYVFSFRGRRRRLVLRCPSWIQAIGRCLLLPRLLEFLIKRGAERRRARAVRKPKNKDRPLWIVVGRDLMRVGWPAVAAWTGITWIFVR